MRKRHLFIFALALAPVGVSQGMQMSHSLDQCQKLTQKLSLIQSHRLTLEQYRPLVEAITEIIRELPQYIKTGVLKRDSLKLFPTAREFFYFRYDRSKGRAAALEILLKESGGGFLFPHGPYLVIDPLRFPPEFQDLVAIHEYAEYVFGSHEQATAVEFFYARKTDRLAAYIDWLEDNHFEKTLNLTVLSETLIKEIIAETEFPKEAKTELNRVFFRNRWHPSREASIISRNLLGIDHTNGAEWFRIWPSELNEFVERMRSRTARMRGQITRFGSEAEDFISLLSLKITAEEFQKVMDEKLNLLFTDLAAETNKPHDAITVEAVWRAVISEIVQHFDLRRQQLSQVYQSHPEAYQAWMLQFPSHPIPVNRTSFQENIRSLPR